MLLDMMDIVGYKPQLMIFEKDRYKTLFGKLIGSIAIVSILVLCLYFTITTYLRNEISLIYNVSYSDSIVDLSSSPLMMILTDGLNNPISDKYYELRLNFWNFTTDANAVFSSLKTDEMLLEPCNPEDFGEYKSSLSDIRYEKLKCIPSNKYNISLFGKYGESKPNSFLNIAVNMCNNKTTNNTCPQEKELEPRLKNAYLHISFLDYEVDHYNYEQPIKRYMRTETFPINWDLHSRYFTSFASLNYETDDGSVFVNKRQQKSYKFIKFEQTVQIRHGSALYPGVTIGTITIYRQPSGDQYNRSYPKLQTLLARIGGSIQGIMMISKAICYILTKNLFLLDMINLNFENEMDGEGMINSSKLKSSGVNQSSNLYISTSMGIKMNIMNLKKPKTKTEKVSVNKFKPGICNYICPNFLLTEKNKYAKYIITAENILNKKMSFENIFRHLMQYERLKKVLFSDEHNKLINNLPKIKFGELVDEPLLDKNELSKIVNLMDMNRQDKINRKLIKFFMDN